MGRIRLRLLGILESQPALVLEVPDTGVSTRGRAEDDSSLSLDMATRLNVLAICRTYPETDIGG